MIYERFKTALFLVLRAPRQPPDPPAGSAGSVETFRAAPNFLTYQMVRWGLGFAGAVLAEVI